MELQDHSFLSIFEGRSAARLMEGSRLVAAGDGSVIFREKDAADALFLVLQGKVSLSAEASGRQEFLAEAGPDDYFGEFGVMDGEPRSAAATANGHVLLARIPRAVLIEELGGPESGPAIRLMLHTIRKMRQSNRHHVEEVLRREKMSLLGQVVLGVVHDFRSPFSAILMATELMQSGRADAEATRQCCEVIIEQIERVNAMAEEVLDYSRGKTNLRIEQVRLPGLIHHFVALNEQCLRARGVELRAEAVDSCVVLADPGRIQRILQNLVYNAADAMGSRGGRIIIGMDKPGRDDVCIHVADNGPGIPEDIRERVFEPFQTKGKAKGLGLGLAIARQFAEAHDGSLTCDTAPGGGTTFHLRLPLGGPQAG